MKKRLLQKKMEKVLKSLIFCALALVLVVSCKTVPKPVKNSLAYFNTYYNANRLMVATEDEFFYFDEKQRVKPRIIIIEERTLPDDAPDASQAPKFVQSLVISKEKLAPVLLGVDSILYKGSKILTRHAESDFIDATLFLMAKAYFYKSDWFQAQVKCQELMDNYPYSVLSPDAHLLLAKAYLLQAKFPQAENALLKAIDISWGQHRYDALSEAFRIQAEIALHFGNTDDAIKPYRRAITQADDIQQQSRWQLEIGLLYYRQKKFQEAITELNKALWFSPDALTRYEAELYIASSQARTAGMEKAAPLFERLITNRSVTEWRAFAYGELINSKRITGRVEGIDSLYTLADTLKTPEALAAARYQGGVQLLQERQFQGALSFFSKAQIEQMPSFFYAHKYLQFLSDWQLLSPDANSKFHFFTKMREDTATFFHPNIQQSRVEAASLFFRTGRVFDRLGIPDSALFYYQAAVWTAPEKDTNRARYLFAEAATLGMDKRGTAPTINQKPSAGQIKQNIPTAHIDSLLNVIAFRYPTTEQGREARTRLGLTQAAVRDTASELIQSAEQLRGLKKYNDALKQYASVVQMYPNTRHAPRALYAQGWLYERDVKNLDSALRYYALLIEKYPESQFANEVRPSYDAALEYRRLQDSTRAARLNATTATSSLAPSSTTATLVQSTGGTTAPARRRK